MRHAECERDAAKHSCSLLVNRSRVPTNKQLSLTRKERLPGPKTIRLAESPSTASSSVVVGLPVTGRFLLDGGRIDAMMLSPYCDYCREVRRAQD